MASDAKLRSFRVHVLRPRILVVKYNILPPEQ